MSLVVGLLNVLLGTVYTCYGFMTIHDLRRGSSTRGFRHFGFAWMGIAFTCGPHHLDHGVHALFAGRPGGGYELLSVVAGLPFAVIWFALRVEALFGGPGDRVVSGTPRWLIAAAGSLGALAVVLGSAVGDLFRAGELDLRLVPNLAMLVLYCAIGTVLALTQIENRSVTGAWSLSGVSLSLVMFTCSVMHAVVAAYGSTGYYDVDIHGLIIAILSVPSGAYFLWVVSSIHRGVLFNDQAPASAPSIEVGV